VVKQAMQKGLVKRQTHERRRHHRDSQRVAR
jgi:hypothetical protein